jgi:protein-disulfide isomerase
MIKFKDFYIDFYKTDFTCPHCEKLDNDNDNKLFDRIKKNKSWITKVKCDCGKPFFLTVNFEGYFQTFKNKSCQ